MSEEFKIIDTQEAFDEATKGYIKPEKAHELKEKIAAQEAEINDLKSKNKAFEKSILKSKIAYKKGIPCELAERLSGETEDEICKDAEKLSAYLSKKNVAETPDFVAEKKSKNGLESAFFSMIQELKN